MGDKSHAECVPVQLRTRTKHWCLVVVMAAKAIRFILCLVDQLIVPFHFVGHGTRIYRDTSTHARNRNAALYSLTLDGTVGSTGDSDYDDS